jgi:hypothetical protein
VGNGYYIVISKRSPIQGFRLMFHCFFVANVAESASHLLSELAAPGLAQIFDRSNHAPWYLPTSYRNEYKRFVTVLRHPFAEKICLKKHKFLSDLSNHWFLTKTTKWMYFPYPISKLYINVGFATKPTRYYRNILYPHNLYRLQLITHFFPSKIWAYGITVQSKLCAQLIFCVCRFEKR